MLKRAFTALASLLVGGAHHQKSKTKAPTLRHLDSDLTKFLKSNRTRFKLRSRRVPGGDRQERDRRMRQIAEGRATYPVYSSLNPRELPFCGVDITRRPK